MQSEKYRKIIEHVLRHEGVYSDNAADRGGKTKYGITESVWKQFHNNLPPYPIKDITKKDAENIYYRNYWVRPGLNKIESLDASLLGHIFDACVNHGPGTSIKLLQRAFNLCKPTRDARLKEDGVLGPNTRQAILSFCLQYEDVLLAAFCGERYCLYKRIVEKNASQLVFIRGWLRRLL